MPKLMVAGCSFSAASQSAAGTSWAELMAEDLGWQLIHLARQESATAASRS